MIQLLLASLLVLQDPPAASSEWKDVDGIALIINEETLTERGFLVRLARYLHDNPGSDKTAARDALQTEIVRNAIGSQAGEAMGIDPNAVRRSVREYERRMIESRGGVDQYAAYLKGQGQTAEEVRTEIEKFVLRDMWEKSRTGEGTDQNQKVIADRFIRPGMLRLSYSQLTRDPRLVDRIGGSASQVVLQILEIDPARVGGISQAAAAAAAIRARIASGESDFEREFQQFGLSGSLSGPRDPADEAALAANFPDFARLVAKAKEGELLPPIPPSGTKQEWRIVRLLKRTPAVVPEFRDPGVQKKIRELLQDMLDERRLDAARREQFEGSYIWPARTADR